MLKLISCLVVCQICLPLTSSRMLENSFQGQCPKFMRLPYDMTNDYSFTGTWYQYAVYPDYLQDKCIKREFNGQRFWLQFAHTDFDNFIIQYYCYEHRSRELGRQHMRSISIYAPDPQPSAEVVESITFTLKRHFKFPMRLLNLTDYSFCTEIEELPAVVRV